MKLPTNHSFGLKLEIGSSNLNPKSVSLNAEIVKVRKYQYQLTYPPKKRTKYLSKSALWNPGQN